MILHLFISWNLSLDQEDTELARAMRCEENMEQRRRLTQLDPIAHITTTHTLLTVAARGSRRELTSLFFLP